MDESARRAAGHNNSGAAVHGRERFPKYTWRDQRRVRYLRPALHLCRVSKVPNRSSVWHYHRRLTSAAPGACWLHRPVPRLRHRRSGVLYLPNRQQLYAQLDVADPMVLQRLASNEKALRELNETLEQRVEDETRERLQIWNVSQDLLVVADLEGKYLSVNPAWTATFGWSNSELLGRTSQWLLHPDDQDRTSDAIGHLAAGRKALRFESRFRHKDGSYRWISWNSAPDGGRIYAMGRDVTELKDAENLLREARAELAHFARRTMLTTMTASIAHEISQPLAAVAANGNAGLRWLARTEPDLDEVRQALKRVVENSHRAGDIVAGIRAMFRKDDQKKETFNVNDLVRDVFALVRGELERHKIVLRSELSEELPKIAGERVPLQQVLLNLIMNAVEAMVSVTDRARVLRIRSNTIEEACRVAVTVEDSGTGIAGKDKDRIFEAFFTTKPEGMGMGLSICQSIVEAHGGRLWVTPGMPQGSVFHVQLPIGG